MLASFFPKEKSEKISNHTRSEEKTLGAFGRKGCGSYSVCLLKKVPNKSLSLLPARPVRLCRAPQASPPNALVREPVASRETPQSRGPDVLCFRCASLNRVLLASVLTSL